MNTSGLEPRAHGSLAGAAENGAAKSFQALRPTLFAIAYRMLASVGDAEDVLQEAYLRYRRALARGTEVGSPRAYLAAVVTRLAMDQLRSARARREQYVGLWLPEPLPTEPEADDPAHRVEREESLSMAFLLVLERLNPVERAVFLLHDVFGYGHDEIAAIVGKSEANCRQIAVRARRRVRAERPRFDTTPEQRARLAERFFAAVTDGDVDGLARLLAADAAVYGDGGGKVPQWAAPITGADRVARLLAGIGRQMRELELRFQRRELNAEPGALVTDADGRILSAFVLEIGAGRVRALRSVVNPDKLRHLGAVADYRALAAQRRRET